MDLARLPALLAEWEALERMGSYQQASFERGRHGVQHFVAWVQEHADCAGEVDADVMAALLHHYRESLIRYYGPFRAINTQRGEEDMPLVLTPQQVLALLAAAREDGRIGQDYTILMLLAQTGMRLRECCALHMNDVAVDADPAVVQVAANAVVPGRTVPLPPDARAALQGYLVERASILQRHQGQRPASAVWLTSRGLRAGQRGIEHTLKKRVFEPLITQGTLPSGTTAQALRFTYAARYLVASGRDRVGLAARLGLNLKYVYATSLELDLTAWTAIDDHLPQLAPIPV